MSERRFVIKEVTDNYAGYWHINPVSENELKRRFIEATQTIITERDTGEMVNWYEVLPVLLHGDGEKGGHNCKDTPKRVGNDIYCDSCGKLLVEYSNVEQDQPSPTPKIPKQTTMGLYRCDPAHKGPKKLKPSPMPTRAEWEAFERELGRRYHECPSNASADSILLAVLNAVAAVNRSMPCVPKEEE